MGLRELLETTTPGPWKHGYSDGSGRAEDSWRPRHELGGGYITHGESEDAVVLGADDSWSLPQGVQRVADATLIALAPDLAQLAIDMAAFIRGDYHPPTRAAANALLARFAALNQRATT